VKTVYLHGKLGKRFGEKWKLAVRSPMEAFSAIEANQEGFLSYMLEREKAGVKYFVLNKNPKKIKSEAELESCVVSEKNVEVNFSSDELHIIPKVKGEDPLTVTLFTIGAVEVSALTILLPMAISFVVGAIMKALNKPPKRSDPTTTKSYLLKGGQNRQAQGIAVPLGYGRLKIGSTNIAEKTEAKRLTGGGTSQSENPSALESFSQIEFLDLLSEGPIEGLADQNGNLIVPQGGKRARVERGVFLNNVPIETTPHAGQVSTSNYILNEDGIMPVLKEGSEDDSTIIADECYSVRKYDAVLYGSAPYANANEGIHQPNSDEAIKAGAKVASHYVGNSEVSKVSFTMRAEVQIQNDDGSTAPTEIRFAILVEKDHVEKNVLDPSSGCKALIEAGAGLTSDGDVDGYFKIEGIASSSYEFNLTLEHEKPQIKSRGVTFKFVRLTRESDPTTKSGEVGGLNKRRLLQFASVVEFIKKPLLYPHSAVIKVLFDSKNFSSLPERSYHAKLKKVPVPTNYNPETRVYDGPWDGLFKGQADSESSIHSIPDSDKAWTDNPAWVFFDLLYNPRYGVGKFGLEEENIDKWQLYNISKYCDELVETEYPIETQSEIPLIFSKVNNTTIKIPSDQFEGAHAVESGNRFSVPYVSFVKDFGDGDSFAGKSVALFVDSSGSMKKSVLRSGETIIRQFRIKSSSKDGSTVTLSGAEEFLSSFSDGAEVGACATQINHPIVEPRFTANLYLTDRSEALGVINNLASIFRGITAYSSGKIMAMQDSFKNPVALFNNSNVSPKGFTYSGPNKDQKSTAVLVRFNNKDNNFLPEVAYEEDADSMQRLGYQEEEILGLGITSSSQARRMARWALTTMQLEIETVSFECGAEASYLFPGAIFEVSDEIRAGRSKSGRVISVGLNSILLDKTMIDEPFVGQVELSVCVGMSRSSLEMTEQRAPFERSSLDQDAEIESSLAPQVIRFECRIGVSPDSKKGPRGQSATALGLRVKFPLNLDLELNAFTSFNHGFEDEELVEFVSEGTLPAGLSKGQYEICNKTIHTFQVKRKGTNVIVNILDAGEDYLGNKGGIHYVMPYYESNSKNSEYLNKIPVGAPWSAKGSKATKTAAEISAQGFENLGMASGDLSSANWFFSSWLGWVWWQEKTRDFAHSPGLGWLYVGEAINSTNGEYWFTVGTGNNAHWFFTTDGLADRFWYYHGRNGEGDPTQAGTWVIPYYAIISEGQYGNGTRSLVEMFVYDDSAGRAFGQSVGEMYRIAGLQKKIVQVYSSSTVRGYFIELIEGQRGAGTIHGTLASGPMSNPNDTRRANPFRKEAAIESFSFVSAENSACGEDCVRVALNQTVSSVKIRHNMEIFIEDTVSSDAFDDDINNVYVQNGTDFDWSLTVEPWRIFKINDFVFELINSNNLYSSFDVSNITTNGKISVISSIDDDSVQNIESQMFRTMSVKEMSEGKYEVAGLEYNQGKFNAVDKKTVVRRPIIPIPPQADMSIPEPPESLILTDLSK
jgi:predicted phage tail protein